MNDEYIVYVLYSNKFDKTYTGYTSNLIERFKSHNHLGKKGYCIRYRPWQVILVEFFKNKSEARKRELFLKSGAGRSIIRKSILS
jgi:putative endonuclease